MKISVLTKSLFAMGLLTLPLITGCSGSDDDDGGSGGASTPVEGCQSLYDVLCESIFGCFSSDELNSDVVGLNEADCKTKLTTNECTDIKTRCDSGKAYQPATGQQCIDQTSALSCEQLDSILSGNSDGPSACEKTAYCQ